MVNNHWNVNFAASQSGRIVARRFLLPQGTLDIDAAKEFAALAYMPPVVVRAYDAQLMNPEPLFELHSSDLAPHLALRPGRRQKGPNAPTFREPASRVSPLSCPRPTRRAWVIRDYLSPFAGS